MTDNDDLGTPAGIRRMIKEAQNPLRIDEATAMTKPKVIDLLTFGGEGPVPCVRKSDYDALAAELEQANRRIISMGEMNEALAARLAEAELSRDSWKREAKLNQQAADESAGYARRLAEAERDAARYRWLRDRWLLAGDVQFPDVPDHDSLSASHVDDAFDAAMAADSATRRENERE